MSTKEKRAEVIYNEILRCIENFMSNNTSTFQTELDLMGKLLFGDKYMGTFASDEVPNLTMKRPYAILNLDRSDESGSHWISIALVGAFTIYTYDSFGRSHVKIIPSLSKKYKKIKNVDLDPEQRAVETNCGQRALSWLYLLDNWGIGLAKLV